MTTTRTLRLAAVLLLVAACAGEAPRTDTAAAVPPPAASTTAAPAAGRADSAAAVAKALAANPAKADSILTAAGHTRASFAELMYDIAADSAMSATYAAAHER